MTGASERDADWFKICLSGPYFAFYDGQFGQFARTLVNLSEQSRHSGKQRRLQLLVRMFGSESLRYGGLVARPLDRPFGRFRARAGRPRAGSDAPAQPARRPQTPCTPEALAHAHHGLRVLMSQLLSTM